MPENIASLADLAIAEEQLLPGARIELKNATVYENVTVCNPPFGRHLCRDIYTDRVASLNPVSLVKLPPGCTVVPREHFATFADGVFVEEQYPVFYGRDFEQFSRILESNGVRESFQQDVLLIARYGIYTWGHWLGELLPKVAIIESMFPGRFVYALPAEVLSDPRRNLPWLRIRQSMEAYNIDKSRIVSLDPQKFYDFSNLYAVSSVWSDHVIHPAALKILRDTINIPGVDTTPRHRLSIQRVAGYGRTLLNQEEVFQRLAPRGFTLVSFAELSFAGQVRSFQSSEAVCSVLGSDLTGLLYAPAGIKVVALAPADFGDRFFYALTALRGGSMADVRGVSVPGSHPSSNKSDFRVDVADVEMALQKLAIGPTGSR